MLRSSMAVAIAAAIAVLPGCENSEVAQTVRGRAVVDDPMTSEEKRAEHIRSLVEKLAISSKPAAMAPVYTPDVDTPKTDKRVIAFEAARELREYGKEAFPFLLEHLDDHRQSVAFRRVLSHSVGLACSCIIEDQVFSLPRDYPGSFYRRGSDGELHPRPYFMAPTPLAADPKAWLNERRSMTLREMQTEALEWYIEEEKKIGFPTPKDRETYLTPLLEELRELKQK